MLEYLISLVGRLGHWGYLIMFLGAMLESAAFLGVIIPGESLVVMGGFFAAQGLFDLDVLIIAVAIGATLGDSIGYEMGRWLGQPVLAKYGSRFGANPSRVAKAEVFFKRHGGKAVFLGRFVGFARALVPFIAGSSQMRYRLFLPYNALGAALWSTAVTLLGYFLGASWQAAAGWLGRASAILGGVLLFFTALMWLWNWSVRHEAGIRRHWVRFLSRPRIMAARHRFAPQIAFIEARLSAQGYLGLQLTLGALIMIGAGWLFGGISEDVIHGDPLTVVDVHVAQWLHEHMTPLLTQSMLILTDSHGTLAISIFVVITALALTWKRDWYWLLTLMEAVPGGALLNELLKHAFQRARPTFDDPLLTLVSYSFPSGHTVTSTLFYGVLAALIISKTPIWRWRVLTAMGAFALVALVAFSRIYLGVHYLSDVLAGFAEGIAWLALCLTATHTFARHRAQKHSVDTVGDET
ncbi:MAG: bifunctional DedA family/phosphatase PAP2 family protein [Burkholderiaceae bacterium]